MKKICALLLLVILPTVTLQAKPPAKGKITRDEAQHIALKQTPDGSVKSARLEQKDGRAVWAIEIAKRDSSANTQIYVDATNGQIVAGAEPASPAEGASKEKH